MKMPLRLGLFAFSAALLLPASRVQGQCLDTFPADYVPLDNIYYISDANPAGDLLVVGQMTFDAYRRLNEIPLPSSVDQVFCAQVELAPGFFADAYVPTAAERLGSFGDFDGLLLDPLTGDPFPFGIIPISRLPDPFAWRIPASPVFHTDPQHGVRDIVE